jgi:hypothetical protein
MTRRPLTPRMRFELRLGLYQMALYAYFVLCSVGVYLWLDPERLAPDEREMWPFSFKGNVFEGAVVAGFVVYLVAITRFRCPRCHERLRMYRDLGGLSDWSRKRKNPCPHCGLNFNEEWPQLTTVSGAVEDAERWALGPKNPIS